MKILSLDQASVCGFAVVEDGEIIHYGSQDFNKIKNYTERVHSIKKYLETLIKLTRPQAISIEGIQQQANVETFRKLSELKGVLENLIFEKNIPYFVITSSEWRSGLGIKGRKRAEYKENAIEFINNNFDISLKDEDCCEAICQCYYVYKKYGAKTLFCKEEEDCFR